MIIFGGPGGHSGSREPRTLLGPEDAAIVEASRYNQDISFAFGAQPRLREAEKGLLESLGQSAAPDGRGFADGFLKEYDKSYQGILGEAPSARAREITSELTANMRKRAAHKALVFEAERRGTFFRKNLEDSIATAKQGVLDDPEGAEETFSDLLGTLSFAANGWLGREKGEETARGLQNELFESAVLALIERDPSAAREKLGQGLFGDNLSAQDRARLQQAATRRIASPVFTTPEINDTSADHQYIFAVAELAADRTISLPLLLANDTFVFAAFAQLLTKKTLKDYGETVNAIGSIGGGTQDIDLTLGNVVTGTVDTSATTFTFSNPPASGTAGSFTLKLTNGGSQTVTWPASVDWPGGAAPTLIAAGVDVLTFFTTDGGTIWYGFPAGLDMK